MASFITLIIDGREAASIYSTLPVEENFLKIKECTKSSGRFISSAEREKCSWIKVKFGSKWAIYRIRKAANPSAVSYN